MNGKVAEVLPEMCFRVDLETATSWPLARQAG
jgi:translation initiation factor IF-1